MKKLWVAGFLVLAACRPGAPHPMAMAADEALKAPPNVVYDAALVSFTDQSLPLKINDPEHGVLESEYFDVSQYIRDAANYPPAERFMRIRVLVGPDTLHSQGSRLGVQAIYSPFGDPTSATHRSERALPKSHPGMEVVKALVTAVKEKTKGYER